MSLVDRFKFATSINSSTTSLTGQSVNLKRTVESGQRTNPLLIALELRGYDPTLKAFANSSPGFALKPWERRANLLVATL